MRPPLTSANRFRLPRQTALTYALVGCLWILLSDAALDLANGGPSQPFHLHSLKGLLFVGITAAVLYKLMAKALERAEEELRTQEQRWKLALEAVGDGVWESNLTTGHSYYSPKWKAMLGYGESEIGDKWDVWINLIHPDDRPNVESEVHRCLKNPGQPFGSEFRLRAKDGSYRWILSRGSFVSDERPGSDRRIIGTHTDITERKVIEARNADSLAFIQTVLSSSPGGIVVFRRDGQAVIANQSAALLVGTDVPGLLRQNFRELDSWCQCGLLKAADRALTTATPVSHRGELVTTLGRSLWIDAQLVPFNYEGEQHLLLIFTDETGKRSALDKLHLMQAAVQAAPLGWMVTDAQGLIEWVNPGFTTLTGYSASEAVGQSPRILKSDQHLPSLYTTLWDTIRAGQVWSGPMTNKRKDGTFYHQYSTITPVAGADGKIVHYVAVMQDMSEQKALEQQLARTQRLESIGQLATGMVHDLNNMLSPIMLALGMIRTRHHDPETLAHVQMMEAAAQRGAGVLRQVLTFARGVEGERTLLEPKLLIKEVSELAQETFPRQIRIESEFANDLAPISGDLTQLHQVLLNLAVNARDAMPDGGVLQLYARNATVDTLRAERQVFPVKAGEYVRFGVRDTGTGIPPHVVEHMFEPFYTTKPPGKGTGLGLSTVFGVVRSHGGFIEVDTKLGRGTDISVLLPAVARPVAAVDHTIGFAHPINGNGRKLLVVDDEAAIRSVTCQILERRGFLTVPATDGVDALAKFHADPGGFTAVLTDMMMPRMSGYKLAVEIRRHAPLLPIIASTGMSSPEESEHPNADLAEIDVRTLLNKPYTEAELLQALRAELGPP